MALVAVGLFACVALHGQLMSDEYELEYASEESFRTIVSDTGLLLAPLGSGETVFGRMARYNFNFVSYRDRGMDGRLEGHFLGNLDFSTAMAKYPDYALYSTMRFMAPSSSSYRTAEEWAVGGVGVTQYGLRPTYAREERSLRLSYSEQRYRANARLSYVGPLGKGWYAMLKGQYRTGRDRFIDGVFTEGYWLSAGLEKEFTGAGSLSFVWMRGASERGLRAWTVQETFDLIRDNLYNPLWGRFDGKQRNSRVRRDVDDVFAIDYSFGKYKTRFSVSLSYRTGERARSGLAWWNAANPMPDYYRNLPSYYADPAVSSVIGSGWADGAISQVDWENMWNVNTHSTEEGRAVYIADERVERIGNTQAAISGDTRLGSYDRVVYGLRGGMDRSNFFRRAKDMLGAQYIYDYDQYLFGDMYSGEYRNDLQRPDREVREGDRFGYDYDIRRRWTTAFAGYRYSRSRWGFYAGTDVTFSSLYREGYNEKETYPGPQSLGRSERFGFTAYNAKLSARYSPKQSHHIAVTVFAAEKEPAAENIFLAPASHNLTAAEPLNMFLWGGELKYSGQISHAVGIDVAAYYNHSSDETEIYRHYDDLAAAYVLMPLSGIEKRFMGVELGLSADITSRLRLTAGAAFNSYEYAADAIADIYTDLDLTPIVEGAVSRLKGYVCSQSPQTVFSASLRYSVPYTWSFEASFACAAGRYVSIDPSRRIARVAEVASSPEAWREFTEQEMLPAAWVVNLYVSRRFRLLGMDMFASVAVNNLLGRKDMIYSGYEQMRLRQDGSGVNATWSPFPSKYAYAYPRSLYATLIINF